MPEIVMIVIVMFVLAVPAVIVIALVWYFTSRRKSAQPPQAPRGIPERLAELDGLRARNLITEAEYDERRRQILAGI